MVPFTFDDLVGCRRAGRRVDLVVRPSGEVTYRLVDVVVVAVHADDITVETDDGSRIDLKISTLVNADLERTQRRSRRRFGHFIDAVTSIGR